MPDAAAQFRNAETPQAYMGGYSASCGNHPSLPKRHRWGPWEQWGGGARSVYWDRTCQLCALVSESRYNKPRGLPTPPERA